MSTLDGRSDVIEGAREIRTDGPLYQRL